MHQVEGVHEVLRDRNGPPVLTAALEGRDPDLARLEVDVAGPDAEGLAHPGAGHCEDLGEGPDRWTGVFARYGEEARALGTGEVLPAAGIDEGEAVLAHRLLHPVTGVACRLSRALVASYFRLPRLER